MADISIHPAVDGAEACRQGFRGRHAALPLRDRPVEVASPRSARITTCAGARSAGSRRGAVRQVAVVPSDKVRVTENGDKLAIVNPNALILRHACRACGVHMHGPVERPKHPFTGLVFIHTERAGDGLGSRPGSPRSSRRSSSRAPCPIRWPGPGRLKELGLQPYDCLSPRADGRHRDRDGQGLRRAARPDRR